MNDKQKDSSPYEQGHLIVAAVRLFYHREGKMPTYEDIAALTGLSKDLTLHLCNKLIEMEILRVVSGAFNDRYHIKDHLKLEDLPRVTDGEQMGREVEKFKADRLQKQKKIEELFRGKEHERLKKDRIKNIDGMFKDPGGKKRPNPLDSLTGKDSEKQHEDS